MSELRFGQYRVVRKLGEGGMGIVYEVVHEEIGKRAAIKVLHATYARDPQIAARFLTEARAVNMVHHPGVVSIFEFGRTPDGAAYMVMEFLEGETLRQRIERLKRIPIPDAQRILRQMANALAAAHEKNIVHRDLKPENVILVPEPEMPGGERAKVLDFGVAKVTQPSTAALTMAGAMLGTPAYMAPEQCMSAMQVDEKADVYALGIILYELLTGTVPFMANGVAGIMLKHLQEEPQPARELLPEIPDFMAALLDRMLVKTPAERPTAREVARALEAPAVPAMPAAPAIPVATAIPMAPAIPMATAVPVTPAPLPVAQPNAGARSGPMSAAQSTVGQRSSPLSAAQSMVGPRPPVSIQRGNGANIVENWLYLDHPLANNDPNAMVYFTANWNPGGQGGTYNNHHTGVWYVSNGRWAIYNEDRAPMPPSAAFNVLVSRAGFIHRATPANIVNNWTLLDHPDCNKRPDVRLLISANWNPGGVGGTYNNHALGVWYTDGKWSIFNQDRVPLPSGTAFNVLVADQTFCHRVTANNLLGSNGTWIDHPSARGNPDAVVLITANWNPGGQGGLYHDHALGVYYYGDRWAIFNQDMAPMPIGVAFNVWIV